MAELSENKIKELISGFEDAEVEFKSAKGGLPESLWESLSAFANTNGGVIILGIKEKDGRFYPDGLTDDQIVKYKKLFWDGAHNKEKISVPLLMESDIHLGEVDGNKILIFHIPRASFDLRPVYLTPNPMGHTFKRNHEGDYHCTDLEVRQMFSDSQHANMPFDNEILQGFTIEDIDMESFRGYRQRFNNKKGRHPWTALSDLDFMKKIGAFREDRATGKNGFSRGGILMFGKTESIQDPSCAQWYFPDYQEKMSPDPKERWSDRLYPDGTWEANLYQFFFKTYNKLAHTMPTPFRLDGIERVDETSAHVALREALVNLCVHTSYAEQGNMVIIRKPNSIVFRNPGRMLISPEDFYAGSHSECRNPVIQKMFMLLGYGEKAGSGADFILQGWADNNWPRPQIMEMVQPDCVELAFDINDLVKSMSTELSAQKGEKGTQKAEQKELTEQATEQVTEQVTEQKTADGTQTGTQTDGKGTQTGTQTDGKGTQTGTQTDEKGTQTGTQTDSGEKTIEKIYSLMSETPNITRRKISEILNISEDAVKKHIQRLKLTGRIIRIGGDFGGHWQCID